MIETHARSRHKILVPGISLGWLVTFHDSLQHFLPYTFAGFFLLFLFFCGVFFGLKPKTLSRLLISLQLIQEAGKVCNLLVITRPGIRQSSVSPLNVYLLHSSWWSSRLTVDLTTVQVRILIYTQTTICEPDHICCLARSPTSLLLVDKHGLYRTRLVHEQPA